jgi:hypothetical protein
MMIRCTFCVFLILLLLYLHISTGKPLSEAFILTSTNPQYDKMLFIDLPVQYMKTTSWEHVVYINCSEYKKKKNCVHNMFWACSFHVLNWYINGQSFVILWVSWSKNKCFRQRFTCTLTSLVSKQAEISEQVLIKRSKIKVVQWDIWEFFLKIVKRVGLLNRPESSGRSLILSTIYKQYWCWPRGVKRTQKVWGI